MATVITLGTLCRPVTQTMNFVDIPVESTGTPARRETKGTDSGDDGGPHRLRVSMGGDATDILPDEALKSRLDSSERADRTAGPPAATVRGDFAQLQRELETKIERFDRAYDVCHEDPRLIVYRLTKQKDYEYIFDYCEIDDRRIRHALVELMEAIAVDRMDETPRYPLVVRKPAMFRSGERHALFRLSTPTGGDEGAPQVDREH